MDLYGQAVEDYRAGRPAQALRRLDEAARLAPTLPGLEALRGWVLLRLDRSEEAERAFRRAAELDPSAAEPLTGLGHAALRRGDALTALGWFEAALALDGGDAVAGRGRVEALLRLGRPGEAALALDRLQADGPAGAVDPELAARVGAAADRPDREERPRPATQARGTPRVIARAGRRYLEVPAAAGGFRPLFIKGVNLGVALPGRFPSQFPGDETLYRKWLGQIAAMNANAVRLYTLLPPAFYRALAAHNRDRAERPLWLIQGVWAELPPDDDFQAEAYRRDIRAEVERVLDALHGNLDLPPRPGRAAGRYRADVSEHALALILGREWEPFAVAAHDGRHPGEQRYDGRFAMLRGGSAMEAWLAWLCDAAMSHDSRWYGQQRPVAFSNWPTLDPLVHPTETSRAEEIALRRARGETIGEIEIVEYNNDAVSVDAERIVPGPENLAGLFASYHVYPYYPDFLNLDPGYLAARDADGPNPYLGYLRELKAHHGSQPLLVAELGVPTSRGVAHVHPTGWNHGGHSGRRKGEIEARMMRSVLEAGTAGGILFAWLDEWFKRNWMFSDLEIPPERNPLWHNVLDPEQNFGIVGALAGASAGEHVADGDPGEWAGEDARAPRHSPPAAAARLRRAAAAADAAYLHLLVEVAHGDADGDGEPDWDRWQLLAGIDTVPGERGERRLEPGDKALLPTGAEFRLRLRGGAGSDLQVVPPYDVGGGLPDGPFAPEPAAEGRFVRMGREANRRRYGRDGTVYPAVDVDLSSIRLRHPGDPDAADLADAAVACRDGVAVVEVRLAWGLLNFTDPSSHTVLFQTGRHGPPFGTAVTDAVEIHISLRAAAGDEVDQDSIRLAWDGWESPVHHLRPKEAYVVLRDALARLPDWLPATEPER